MQDGDGPAARIQRIALAQGDHALSQTAGGARLGQCGGDALGLDQVAHQAGQQRLAMRGGTAQLDGFLTMSHDKPLA
jgi:hypothetical protein